MIPTNKMETEKTSQSRRKKETAGTFCSSPPMPTPAMMHIAKYHIMYKAQEKR